MESLSTTPLSSPPIKIHLKPQKPLSLLPKKPQIHFSNPIPLITLLTPLPSSASQPLLDTTQDLGKINLESILVSIDEFFNKYPFFVAGVTFIWLVVIPLTQVYFRKFKFVSAIDAFKKLKEDPDSQMLDIRDEKSLVYLGSPNLRILNKGVVQVQFSEGDEDGFVKQVLERFSYPSNTTLCILDNFDGNSMKVAELLFNNGFKEAYAIKGGIRGKNGWQEIQETLLPPSVHVFPKKKVKKSKKLETNGGATQLSEDKVNNQASSTSVWERNDSGYVEKSVDPGLRNELGSRSSSSSSSPYPNYPDMKPPSSPTPSKPRY